MPDLEDTEIVDLETQVRELQNKLRARQNQLFETQQKVELLSAENLNLTEKLQSIDQSKGEDCECHAKS
mgnify:CR=1 FL=1